MLEKLAGNSYYCFLDGYSGYNQVYIAPEDQEKTTFICPYGTFAFHRMPFGLCNAPATFQRCMLSIFSDMIGNILEIFMDDLSILVPHSIHVLIISLVFLSGAKIRTCYSTGTSVTSWSRKGSSSATSSRRMEFKWARQMWT